MTIPKKRLGRVSSSWAERTVGNTRVEANKTEKKTVARRLFIGEPLRIGVYSIDKVWREEIEKRRWVDFSRVHPYKSSPRRVNAYSSAVVGGGPGDYFRFDIYGRSFTAAFLGRL